MLLNIIYWFVMCLLIVVGALLIYKSYKYRNVNLAWWDYLLYFSVFILWIVVKKSVDITYLVSLITILAVLYLLLATHKKS
ncbi:UNVERIFIED_ORG: succinate-acetate transporter protein [Leuconostoc holzapfelii]